MEQIQLEATIMKNFIMAFIVACGIDSDCQQTDSMAPGKSTSARRKQNVDAAKKSYEQKKEARSSLHKKNQVLMEQQMAILHEMARLEEEARMWEDACNSILHTCERDFNLVAEQPACFITADVDMVEEEGEQLMDYSDERREINYPQEGDDQTALDLSLKTRRAREYTGTLDSIETPPQRFAAHASQEEESAPQRLEPQVPQRCDVAEIDYSTLDLGATQEVELKVQRNRKSKRVTFDESPNSVKNYKSDIFTPPMCTTVH